MKYFRTISLFIIAFSALLFGSDPDKLLKSLQEKYSSIHDFSAEVKMLTNSEVAGKIYYSRVNKFRAELKHSTIISDGTTLWNYYTRDNKVIIDNTNSQSNPFMIDILLYDYPAKCNLSVSKESKNEILILTPKENSGLDFTAARLWINADNLVQRMKVESPQGVLDYTFNNYKLNQNLSASLFTFEVPKGSRVIDLR